MKEIRIQIQCFLSLLLILASCSKSPQSNIVLLESSECDSFVLGTPKRIIKLETSPESSLSYIVKLATDFEKHRIFILSDFNVYIFDSEGDFVTKLRKGNGPGDISMVLAFSLIEKSQQFCVLDNAKRIKIYDYDGKPVAEHLLKGVNAIDIQAVDNENVLLQNRSVTEQEPWFILKYNLTLDSVTRKFVPLEESPYPMLNMITQNSFHFNSSQKTFSASNLFGLYEFTGDEFRKGIEYDLGKKAVPESFVRKTLENKRRSHFGEDARENNYAPYILTSFNYRNFNLFVLDDEQRSCYAIDVENKNKVYFNGSLSAYFKLPKVGSFTFPADVKENFLVFACSPSDFFEENTTAKTTTVNIGDQTVEIGLEENPFLVVVE